MHHLFDPTFADKFRKIVEGRFKRYGHFEYDTEGEIKRYQVRFSSPSRACLQWRTFPPSSIGRLFLINSLTGVGRETTSFRHRQRRVYAPSTGHGQAYPRRGRERVDARHRLWDVSVRDKQFYDHRRCLHWPRHSATSDWKSHRCHESVHDSRWRWTIPHRTTKCE